MKVFVLLFVMMITASEYSTTSSVSIKYSMCEEGYKKSHPLDCGLYLECVYGHFISRDCPKDLHFNGELMVCDYPHSAGCVINICFDQPDGSTFPHNTYRYFIICINGIPNEDYCAIEYDFDVSTGICTDFQTTPWTTPTTTTTIRPPSQPPTTCTNAPDGTTFPHPFCSMYYFCYGGRAHEDMCPPDMHWHVELKMCNYIAAANCKDGEAKEQPDAIPMPTFPTDIPDAGVTTPSSSITTTKSPPTPPNCPATNPEFAVLLPHADCGRYYKCVWGVPVEMKCPQGLHFNVKSSVCDYPERAGCRER